MGEETQQKVEKCLEEIAGPNRDEKNKWIPLMASLNFTMGAISYFQEKGMSGKTPPARLLAKAIYQLLNLRPDTRSKHSWTKFVARMAVLLNNTNAGKNLLGILSPELADKAAIESDSVFCNQVFFTDLNVKKLPYQNFKSLLSTLPDSVWLTFPESIANSSRRSQDRQGDDEKRSTDEVFCMAVFQSVGKDQLLHAFLSQLEKAGAQNVHCEMLNESCFEEPPTTEEALSDVLSDCDLYFVPPKPTEELVGRSKDFGSANQLLKASGSVDIYGERGIGKTSLALWVIYEVRTKYRSIVWLDATSAAALQVSLSNMSALGSDLKQTSSKSLLPESLHKAKQWVSKETKKGSVLIVVDGVNDEETLKVLSQFSPEVAEEDALHVLLTSTDRANGESCPLMKGIQTFHLQKLSNDDVANALCKTCSDRIDPDQTDAATKIAESLAGDPLLMTIVTSYIQKESLTLAEYWEYLQPFYSQERQSTSQEIVTGGAQYTAIFSTIVTGLPVTTKYINLLAFCDTGSIPEEIFKFDNPDFDAEQCPKSESAKKRTPSDNRPLRVTLNRLENYGLIKWINRKTFTLHTKLAKKLRQRQQEKEQKESLKTLCDIFKTALSFSQNDWDFCSSLYPHALQCLKYMDDLNLFDAELLVQCGHMKSLLGDSREARDLLRKCLQADVTKRNRAAALINLATVERRLGGLKLAFENVREARSLLEEPEDSDDPPVHEIIKAKEVQAEILMDAGSFGAALDLLNEIDLTPDLFDSDPASRSSLLANLARANLGLEKFQDAHDLYQKAREILNEGEYRFKLFKTYEHIAAALNVQKTHSATNLLTAFREEVKVCCEVVEKMPPSHRYGAWGYRSLARLKLDEVHFVKKNHQMAVDQKDNSAEILPILKDGFRMIRACLECHLKIASGPHQKVAKACGLVGRLCLEYIDIPASIQKKTACKCAKAHFELALKILQPLVDERLSGIGKRVKAIKSDLKRSLIDPNNYSEEPSEDTILSTLLRLAEEVNKSSLAC